MSQLHRPESSSLALALLLLFTFAVTMVTPTMSLADEGMWTFDHFPAAQLREKYGANITPAWLDRVRGATVRLSNCTASFVSPEGLILTNHHCAAACLAQISKEGQDRLRDGYVAGTRDEEIRCTTQFADVLMRMEDITAKVNAATALKDQKAANEARKKVLTQLETACEKAAGTRDPRRCESVTLYQGGQYFLYHYKRYDDVRIVFAPEQAIAAFGGDPDNFQFPRWCLDMSMLRAYEDGKPAATPNHLKVNWNGPTENELVFVTGHPGTTKRQLTAAQLQAQRAELPLWLLQSAELRGRYIQFSKTGAENERIVADPLNTLENNIKVRRKQMDALLGEALLAQKVTNETQLRARTITAGNPDPWLDIEKAMRRDLELNVPYTFIESAAGFNSSLYRYARTLVRGAAERAKPSEERLREYAEPALPQLVQQLTAPIPVYPAREQLTLSFGLERMREFLGPDHPLVNNLLAELSPDQLAGALVNATQLADPALRKQLWDGGQAAIDASTDPMIRLAKLVDPYARAVRKQYEDEVEAVVNAGQEKISAARFALLGTNVYPDATFTLRLNYGRVQGWNEDATPVVPFSRLARAFERSTGSEPFRMPDSWTAKRAQLDMNTPFNLSTNNDIVGGNSGSPLINASGEIVGLVFDGNIHSISGAFWFDTMKNRAVAVHPAIIRTALTQIYDTQRLARELGIIK
ncbi:MAG: S46 family peptidase [Steroidobacteraceae bacterium]